MLGREKLTLTTVCLIAIGLYDSACNRQPCSIRSRHSTKTSRFERYHSSDQYRVSRDTRVYLLIPGGLIACRSITSTASVSDAKRAICTSLASATRWRKTSSARRILTNACMQMGVDHSRYVCSKRGLEFRRSLLRLDASNVDCRMLLLMLLHHFRRSTKPLANYFTPGRNTGLLHHRSMLLRYQPVSAQCHIGFRKRVCSREERLATLGSSPSSQITVMKTK